jgi:SAM-dependent methyltransferase
MSDEPVSPEPVSPEPVSPEPASHAGPVPFEQRARSFGSVAELYARFRPAPPAEAVDWILRGPCDRSLDLGAGTGALTQLLVPRADHVVAVEPDASMRGVLAGRRLGASVVAAVAEALPLRSACVDAALASSSWHWMDPDTTPIEVGRVLRPGGVLGLLWNHADRSNERVKQLLGPGLPDAESETRRPQSERHRAQMPDDAPFHAQEARIVEWSMTFTVDEIVGMLASYSRVITLPPEARAEVLSRAQQRAEELVADTGESRIELPMRCQCWRIVRD